MVATTMMISQRAVTFRLACITTRRVCPWSSLHGRRPTNNMMRGLPCNDSAWHTQGSCESPSVSRGGSSCNAIGPPSASKPSWWYWRVNDLGCWHPCLHRSCHSSHGCAITTVGTCFGFRCGTLLQRQWGCGIGTFGCRWRQTAVAACFTAMADPSL